MTSSNTILDSAAQWELSVAANYVYVAGGALVLYDTVILSGQEIDLVWKGKQTAATYLLVANRFLSIMFATGTITVLPNLPQLSSCMGAQIYYMVSGTLLPLVWAVFSALRVYALGDRAWRAATIVFLLALMPLGTNLYNYSQYQFSEEDFEGVLCATSVNTPAQTRDILEVITRSFLIVTDAIVLIVTWRKTYETRRLAETNDMKTPLTALVLRDGTLFFATGLMLNLVQLTAFLTLDVKWGGVDMSYLITSSSCVITSRFFVSLRQFFRDESNATLTTSSSVVFESPHTARGTVSVMGGDLDIDAIFYSNGYAEEEEEEEERPEGREGSEVDVVIPAKEAQPAIFMDVEEVPV